VTLLSGDEIRAALESLPGWRYDRGEIYRQLKFPSFMAGIAFINRVAEKAEAANHHPDIESHYNRVRVGLLTWSEGGVTEKDISLAHGIESVVKSEREGGP
jgi:4a-hydroxytetrahydrobiopterin dehydratase